jgi:hypothetical protein
MCRAAGEAAPVPGGQTRSRRHSPQNLNNARAVSVMQRDEASRPVRTGFRHEIGSNPIPFGLQGVPAGAFRAHEASLWVLDLE